MATKSNPPVVVAPRVATPAITGKFTGIAGVCGVCGKPISPNNTTGIGSTCRGHMGKVGAYYVVAAQQPAAPAYMPLTALCNLAQTLGVSRGYAVKLTGGDAGTRAPTHKV